jgi:hypothetical protein
VWEEDRAATGFGVETLQNVLEERVVSATLRGRAEEVAAPLVVLPGVAVPVLDRVRRIGEHDVEGLQPVAFNERRVAERVAGRYREVLDAVQHEVHPGDRRRDVDEFLSVEPERAGVAPTALHLGER